MIRMESVLQHGQGISDIVPECMIHMESVLQHGQGISDIVPECMIHMESVLQHGHIRYSPWVYDPHGSQCFSTDISDMPCLKFRVPKWWNLLKLWSIFRHRWPGADSGGGEHPVRASPPPKIGKNMNFWRKIVIFHTKYPTNFRAFLCSVQLF